MQNLLDTTQSRLAQSLSTQSEQSLSLTHGFFHKVINNWGGGANTLHSLNKSPKNTLHSYKSAKSAKKLFHAIIARAFNKSPNQSKLSVIARLGNAQSWQSKQNKSAQSANLHRLVILRALARSIHFSDLKSKAIRLLCANINAVVLIRSLPIYFTHCLKSRALDTSLRINATLSMTDFRSMVRNIRLCERVL